MKGTILSFDDIFAQLEKVTKGLKTDDQPYKVNLLGSLLALISEARIKVVAKEIENGEKSLVRPFLNIRIQLGCGNCGE